MKVYLVFWQNFEPPNVVGLIFIVNVGKCHNNNVPIWSHWMRWIDKIGSTELKDLCFEGKYKQSASLKAAVWPDVEIKSSPSFPKVAQKGATVVRIMLFTFTQKGIINFDHFLKNICQKDFSKIVQSGHTTCLMGREGDVNWSLKALLVYDA